LTPEEKKIKTDELIKQLKELKQIFKKVTEMKKNKFYETLTTGQIIRAIELTEDQIKELNGGIIPYVDTSKLNLS